MTDEGAEADAKSAADADEPAESDVWTRDTAPQTPYTTRQVWIGLVIFVIGAAVAFGVPLLLT